jgi:hypothetical protein
MDNQSIEDYYMKIDKILFRILTRHQEDSLTYDILDTEYIRNLIN